ncbi:MAG: SagB/ThcOx family dehydrogenase [Clostridia bacterium]
MDKIKNNREFMKSNFKELDEIQTDQELKLPQPTLEKPRGEEAEIIDLPSVSEEVLYKNDIYECMKFRRSRRKYADEPVTLKELSFLLWATQGVDGVRDNNYATIRPVPSGGARHAFETYLAVMNVEGLKRGMYRYLPLSHKLLYMFEDENIGEKVISATLDQKFAGLGSVTFIWSCIPYRSEWRYSFSAHKTMLLDAGHVCQNLYLACEATACGTCAIAAYDQELTDELIKVDGEDEFSIYIAPVGKK